MGRAVFRLLLFSRYLFCFRTRLEESKGITEVGGLQENYVGFDYICFLGISSTASVCVCVCVLCVCVLVFMCVARLLRNAYWDVVKYVRVFRRNTRCETCWHYFPQPLAHGGPPQELKAASS